MTKDTRGLLLIVNDRRIWRWDAQHLVQPDRQTYVPPSPGPRPSAVEWQALLGIEDFPLIQSVSARTLPRDVRHDKWQRGFDAKRLLVRKP
jgi:hypothetical protein